MLEAQVEAYSDNLENLYSAVLHYAPEANAIWIAEARTQAEADGASEDTLAIMFAAWLLDGLRYQNWHS